MPKATKAEKPDEKIVLDLQEFDPTIAELTKMVEVTKNITATDLKDKNQLAIVTENRITLKKARVRIEKAGKEYRDPANAFIKKVLAKEKELVAIIEPEEERLAAIEQEAKELAILEERKEKLPIRKERLLAIDGETEWSNDQMLLGMDSEEFERFYNQCVAEHNDGLRLKAEKAAAAEAERLAGERAALEAEKAKLEAEKAKLEADRLNLEHEKEAEANAAKQAENAKIAEQERVKAEADAKAAEEKKLAKRAKYKKFLIEHGYTEETKYDFKLIETETGYDLFKKVGTFNK